MTEIELTELRDSLVTINNELDALDVRVTALEGNAVPKGTYFNQLKASFENSPECCDCGVTTGCDCTNATPDAVLRSSVDGETLLSVTINGVTYAESIDVPLNIATFTREQVATNYDSDDWALTILNTSNKALCVVLEGFSVENFAYGETNPIHTLNTNPTVVNDGLLGAVTFCLAVNV